MAQWCRRRGHQVASSRQPSLVLSLPAQGAGVTKVLPALPRTPEPFATSQHTPAAAAAAVSAGLCCSACLTLLMSCPSALVMQSLVLRHSRSPTASSREIHRASWHSAVGTWGVSSQGTSPCLGTTMGTHLTGRSPASQAGASHRGHPPPSSTRLCHPVLSRAGRDL